MVTGAGRAEALSQRDPGDGDTVVSYRVTGGFAGVNQNLLEVTGDGRAATMRDGERVVLTLSRAELREIRHGLVDALDGNRGHFGPKCCDLMYHDVEVVDCRQATHRVHFVPGYGGPWETDLTALVDDLVQRVLDEGTVESA